MVETFLSVDPISSARVHRGFYYLTSGEDEGQEEVLEIKDDEEEENGVDEKVKEVRDACDMVMTMGWNEAHTQTS